MDYTFEILDEAVWDDGSPITAKDYEFTLKACLNPHVGTAYKGYFRNVTRFKIDEANPKKFSVTYKRHILGEAIVGGVYIYPEYIFDPANLMEKYTIEELIKNEKDTAWVKDRPDLQQFADVFQGEQYNINPEYVGGAGGYKLKTYIKNDRVVLVKKKNWWGDKLKDKYPLLTANPDRIIYRTIVDQTTAIAALKNGDIDIMSEVEPTTFLELKNGPLADKYNFYTPELSQSSVAYLNMQNPKLSDKKVRKALAHLFNYDEIIDKIMQGLAKRSSGPIHESRSYFNKELKMIDFNPATAKKLLADAGWKDTDNNGVLDKMIGGEKIELSLTVLIGSGSNLGIPITNFVKDEARRYGIELNYQEVVFNQVLERFKTGDYEIVLATGRGHFSFPDDLSTGFHSSATPPNGRNYPRFGNAESDKLVNEIRFTLDPAKRETMYKRIQEMIADEVPAIYIYAPLGRIIVSKRFDNANPSLRRPGIFEQFFTPKK